MLVKSRALGPMVTRLSLSMPAERLCWMNAGPCGCSGGTDENCPGRDLGQFFWSACTTLMSPSTGVSPQASSGGLLLMVAVSFARHLRLLTSGWPEYRQGARPLGHGW